MKWSVCITQPRCVVVPADTYLPPSTPAADLGVFSKYYGNFTDLNHTTWRRCSDLISKLRRLATNDSDRRYRIVKKISAICRKLSFAVVYLTYPGRFGTRMEWASSATHQVVGRND